MFFFLISSLGRAELKHGHPFIAELWIQGLSCDAPRSASLEQKEDAEPLEVFADTHPDEWQSELPDESVIADFLQDEMQSTSLYSFLFPKGKPLVYDKRSASRIAEFHAQYQSLEKKWFGLREDGHPNAGCRLGQALIHYLLRSCAIDQLKQWDDQKILNTTFLVLRRRAWLNYARPDASRYFFDRFIAFTGVL